MKHIFTVHSPITYFCAANVVYHERLKTEDVFFLCSGYYPDSSLGKVFPSVSDKNKTFLQKIQAFNIAKASDTYISNVCKNESFTAYIDLAHYYQKLLITHPLCEQFHFIEEGTASYLAPKDIQELTRIESKSSFRIKDLSELFNGLLRFLRGYNLKVLGLPYFANAFSHLENIKFYGFDEAVYPGVPIEKKNIIRPHSPKAEKDGYKLNKGSIILIEESYFRVFAIKNESIQYCFLKSLAWIKNQKPIPEKVFIKLRPAQEATSSMWSVYLKQEGVNYEILDSNVVLEELLNRSESCIVLGTVSSLLFYANIFGHDAYSNYDLIPNRPKTSFEYADFFWGKVKKINTASIEE